MNAPSVDTIEILQADPTFNTDGWFIGVGMEPPTPPQSIILFDTGGFPPMKAYNRNETYEYPALQIRVRSLNYNDGWQMVEHIKSILHGRANEAWGDNTLYTLIQVAFGPFHLGVDANQRMLFVLNINIQRREEN